MTDHFGLETVQAYMGHVQDNAEESVRRVIEALADTPTSIQRIRLNHHCQNQC